MACSYPRLVTLSFCFLFGRALSFPDLNWTSSTLADPDSFWWDSFIEPDCEEASDGTFAVTGGSPLCVVQVSGADFVPGRVEGGIDGTYKAFACHDGFPIYYRIDSPQDDERVLFFSERDRDWNINKGLVPSPAEVMAFGGDGDAEPRPQLVLSNKWWFVRSSEARAGQEEHHQTLSYSQALESMFMKAEEFRIDCLEVFDADL